VVLFDRRNCALGCAQAQDHRTRESASGTAFGEPGRDEVFSARKWPFEAQGKRVAVVAECSLAS